jgi:hypothetical protein
MRALEVVDRVHCFAGSDHRIHLHPCPARDREHKIRSYVRGRNVSYCSGPSSTTVPGCASDATEILPPFAWSMICPCQATKQEAASLL